MKLMRTMKHILAFIIAPLLVPLAALHAADHSSESPEVVVDGATPAGMALDDEIPVHQVDVEALQRRVWSRGGATIHVSDVPPSHPDFIAVQWWGSLGGFHGLEPALEKPGSRGEHIVSQYFKAISGHAARADQPLDEALRKRWTALVKKHGLPVPVGAATRGDWIRAAFATFKISLPIGRHDDSDGKLSAFKHLAARIPGLRNGQGLRA